MAKAKAKPKAEEEIDTTAAEKLAGLDVDGDLDIPEDLEGAVAEAKTKPTDGPEEEDEDLLPSEDDDEGEDLDLSAEDEGTFDDGESDPNEKAIKTLKKQVNKATGQVKEAEKKVEKSNQIAMQAQIQARDSEIRNIETLIEKDISEATTALDKLEKDQAEAWDEGDNAKASKIGRDMLKEQTRLDRAGQAKKEIDAYKPQWEAWKEQNAGAESASADPYANYSKAGQDWIKGHAEFKLDDQGNAANKFTRKAIAMHHDAVAEGIKVDTPEYFAHIEQGLSQAGLLEDGTTEDEPAPRKPVVRNKPPVRTTSAPSRPDSGGNAGGARSGSKVKLTAQELWAAKESGMTAAEYAQEKYGKKR